MIDFRYHLVSILAIFLSLALGLVLGANALQDPVLRTLKGSNASLHTANQNYRDQIAQAQDRMRGEEQFAQTLAPQIVANRLKDESVVFVQTPGGGQDIYEQLVPLVQRAGGTVTGQVTIQNKFLAEDQLETLDALSRSLRPGATDEPGVTAYDRAGAVLASALVTDQPAKAGQGDESNGAILSSFKSAGYVTTSENLRGRATLAVVIAPSNPYTGKTADGYNKALLSLTGAFDGADRGTVMAGRLTSAQDGGLLSVLRDSGTASKVSSVDTADAASGQVVVVLALGIEMAGKSGAYGVGSGVNGYLPTPVPTVGKA
ncbi:copper transporter [Actinomadura scrupuli]|uniref:copper transporter n=1 Tax=Actinomadura scrupuli TaxID=559629 RepID=UPI003D96CB8E